MMAMGQEEGLNSLAERPGHSMEILNSSENSYHSETKKKGFHPIRAVKKIFKRKGKQSCKENDDSRMASLKSRSTSELTAGEDEQRNRPSTTTSHLGSGLSMSHDSVFTPEHNNDSDIRNAQSIQNIAMQKELMDRLHPPRDSDEDDVGLPYSPCISPTTADVLQQGLREASIKSRSVCSDGSLLSMGSSENDEDSLGLPPCPHRVERREADTEEGASFPLSHKAAHHKISVRPKRTHAVGRHRKLQQLTVASLPATPEDLEESRGNSPDHSWPSIGEATCSSGSLSRASSAMSTSDSTGSFSAGTSPTLKKVLPSHTQEIVDVPIRSRPSTSDWRMKQDNESISRRRTVSESPCKDFEAKSKEFVSMETRSDRAQSVTITNSLDISWASTSWNESLIRNVEVESGGPKENKDTRSSSPLWPELHKENSYADEKPATSILDESIIQPSNAEVSSLNSSTHSFDSELSSTTPVRISNNFSDADTPKTVQQSSSKSNLSTTVVKEPVAPERKTVQRDPSYRVAVQNSREESELTISILKDESKNKKEKEESSGLFSFGSKVKKTESVKEKQKKESKSIDAQEAKSKTEAKEDGGKKDDKNKRDDIKKKDDVESPFFSRIWGSRRSSKKKKDKSENIEPMKIALNDEEAQRNKIKNNEAISPVSTVDVRAMIQNLTARTNSATSVSPNEKNDHKPVPFPKRQTTKSNRKSDVGVESENCSKSMEMLAGPRSLDSSVNSNLMTPNTKRSSLSGSMPRLNSAQLSGEKSIYCDIDADASNDNVMVIEGEVVRLRKKGLGSEEKKKSLSHANIEKPLNISSNDQKRNSKRSSLLSWYGKKDSQTSETKSKKDVNVQDDRKSKEIDRKSFGKISTEHTNKNNLPSETASKKLPEATESGIAQRLSGFWSSSAFSHSNGKESNDKTPKKTNSFIRKSPAMKPKDVANVNSAKRNAASSSSVSDASEQKNGIHSAALENHRPRTQPADHTANQNLPEFMKVQLNRTKVVSDTALDPNISSAQNVIVSPRTKKLDSNGVSQIRAVSVPSVKVEKNSTVARNGNVVDKQETSQIESGLTAKQSFKKDSLKVEEARSKDAKSQELTSADNKSKEGESELMKVFHRRSLKIKDKDGTKSSLKKSNSDVKDKDASKSSTPASNKETSLTQSVYETSEKTVIVEDNTNAVKSNQQRSGMADKRSISLSQDTAPSPRVRTNTSPGVALAATSIDVSKSAEKGENGVPEWRKIAQQRREQREQRERQLVTGNGHADSSVILQNAPKHSGRSKVLDMVSNFQKLQVS